MAQKGRDHTHLISGGRLGDAGFLPATRSPGPGAPLSIVPPQPRRPPTPGFGIVGIAAHYQPETRAYAPHATASTCTSASASVSSSSARPHSRHKLCTTRLQHPDLRPISVPLQGAGSKAQGPRRRAQGAGANPTLRGLGVTYARASSQSSSFLIPSLSHSFSSQPSSLIPPPLSVLLFSQSSSALT